MLIYHQARLKVKYSPYSLIAICLYPIISRCQFSNYTRTYSFILILSLFLVPSAYGNSYPELECGPLKNAYGPFDYREKAKYATEFDLVERAHFTPRFENLTHGSNYEIMGSLDYTLRAIPNHHRALISISNFHHRLKGKLPKLRFGTGNKTARCYFLRAIAFVPDDGFVYALYGAHLHKLKRYKEAIKQYKLAEELMGSTVELAYNMGLTYFELNELDKSRIYAKKAYRQGYPLPGLRDKLAKAGYPIL